MVRAYLSRIRQSKDLPFLAFLLITTLLGVLVTRQYGESWDELQLYKYAGHSLEAYSTWPQQGSIPLTGDSFENYGPAFVMFTRLVSDALARLGFPWPTVDIRHLLYFLTFQVGVWSLYGLCKRWMGRPAALGAAMLFATQPLLWGHAFINPKDTPLLALFLLSLLLGLRMHDSLSTPDTAWRDAPAPIRRRLSIATGFWLFSVLVLFAGTPLWHSWLDSSVRAAANGDPVLLGPLITRLALDLHKVPPEVYVQKFFTAFLWARAAYFWLATLGLLWLYWRNLPVVLHQLSIILPAAAVLGLTSSIRIFGPLAGILVAGVMLWRSGRLALPGIAIYAASAFGVMYLTWPYLWPDPFGHLFQTLWIMSHHPWVGLVLFNGVEYQASQLPAAYMPTLLGIQFTEPVWVLFAAGLALTLSGAVRKRDGSRELLALSLVWFALPLASFVVLRPTMYDNFRQAFFILPPVFLLAGMAFQSVQRPFLQGLLILAAILPGMIQSLHLHPYEYIYYNSFVGGVRGAFRRFELDYWGTSYREAALELNSIASPNANLWVDGPSHLIETYARPDLHIYSTYEIERADHYDFVVALTRDEMDLKSYPQAGIIYAVARDGAILSVIKKVEQTP